MQKVLLIILVCLVTAFTSLITNDMAIFMADYFAGAATATAIIWLVDD